MIYYILILTMLFINSIPYQCDVYQDDTLYKEDKMPGQKCESKFEAKPVTPLILENNLRDPFLYQLTHQLTNIRPLRKSASKVNFVVLCRDVEIRYFDRRKNSN